MADIRIIRLGLSDAGTTAAAGVELTDAEVLAKTEAGNQALTWPISYSGIVDICVDYSGNIYGVDNARHCVVKIEEGGRISWVAGSQTGANGNNATLNNVPAVDARFNAPQGIACDKSGTLYIADYNNHQIRTIKGGRVSVLAGAATLAGFVDGDAATARFNHPASITVDKSGVIWVADYTNHALRKVTGDGTVLTVAGVLAVYGGPTAGNAVNAQANNHTAALSGPLAVTTDLQGNVFIADNGNHIVKKYTADGWLYRHSGGGNIGRSLGVADVGTVATCPAYTCSYTALYNLKADASGNTYLIDHKTVGSRLVKIDRNGTPSEVADWDSNAYHGPYAIAVSPAQTLFVLNAILQ